MLLLVLAACRNETSGGTDAGTSDAGLVTDASAKADTGFILDALFSPITIAAEPQRPGDPEAGYDALVNAGYIGCGVPYSAYAMVNGPVPEQYRMPGRRGLNETLPFNQTAFVTSSSVTVVSPNCLNCHATFLGDELIMGLGDVNTDYTIDIAQTAELAGFLISDPAERIEWRKWADRIQAIAPYIKPDVIGVNPADNIAGILFSHRDPETLAWSDTPLIPPPTTHVVPVDVPPWWRMKKKNAMFYTAAGRGDHARIMMTASTLCIDEIAQAEKIYAYFNDVRAYIASLEAPAYPGTIDPKLAEEGETVFQRNCLRCHGSYGENETYPNLLIPIEEIATDPVMADGVSAYAGPYVDWFNNSFYGRTAYLAPLIGYVAPPLDGIWATAPYLHNGSIPNIEQLLNSTARPKFWSRTFRHDDYDLQTLGWNFKVESKGHAETNSAQAKKKIYDTTLLGYGNQGHKYGDALSGTERTALIEYLKTL